MGQEGIALAIFDQMSKCSHSNYNNCGKGIEKLVEAKEIAKLSLEDQTVIQPEGWYKRRE